MASIYSLSVNSKHYFILTIHMPLTPQILICGTRVPMDLFKLGNTANLLPQLSFSNEGQAPAFNIRISNSQECFIMTHRQVTLPVVDKMKNLSIGFIFVQICDSFQFILVMTLELIRTLKCHSLFLMIGSVFRSLKMPVTWKLPCASLVFKVIYKFVCLFISYLHCNVLHLPKYTLIFTSKCHLDILNIMFQETSSCFLFQQLIFLALFILTIFVIPHLPHHPYQKYIVLSAIFHT